LDQIIPVSVETKLAHDLGVGLGSTLEFDLSGVRLKCRVASLRVVEWRRVSPNFFVVFPSGVLEDAPAFYLGSTRVENAEASGRLQRVLAKGLPNVSVLDLTMILATLDALLQSLELVSRWLAFFLSGAAVLVLGSVLAAGRYQRLKEAALLRVLGASRAQIRWIFATEYVALGFLGATTGLLVALGASWILCVQFFHTPWHPGVGVLAATVLVAVMVTGLAGWATNRVGTRTTPLELLRRV
jgi:putative ABC transport system permease protein